MNHQIRYISRRKRRDATVTDITIWICIDRQHKPQPPRVHFGLANGMVTWLHADHLTSFKRQQNENHICRINVSCAFKVRWWTLYFWQTKGHVSLTLYFLSNIITDITNKECYLTLWYILKIFNILNDHKCFLGAASNIWCCQDPIDRHMYVHHPFFSKKLKFIFSRFFSAFIWYILKFYWYFLLSNT